ncbi:inosine triphosphate pyrophosphatase-like isoform X1 [Argiope bruennichi]|uniref:inosine triphosphate pyrophosphatase-like isoform X1 n=2 Tax=Argiope bruennichi TaxID=94029 RepID=UPI00249486C9|nr:inosine triphosphate pyrophosphatase-like isoform X1 [Argiope bruennichi]
MEGYAVGNDDIHFVSGNPGKISEAESIMKENNIKVKYMKFDLPEYQGEPDFISEAKCKCAASIVKGPVITEDTSLAFDALHGLPGPYVKWFLDKLGPDGLYKLLSGFEDKSASAICTLAFSEGSEQTVHLFHGITRGKIVVPKGNKGFGWDSCFLPEGKDKTYAELTFEEKNTISHRRKALLSLKDYLLQRNKLLKKES